MPNFDIDDLRKNPNTKITFALPPPSTTVEAYMVSDTFSFSGSSNFDSIYEQGLAQALADKSGMGTALDIAKKVTQTSSQNIKETQASWSGSTKPEFSLELVFVAIRNGEDPRKQVLQFLQGVYPINKGAGVMGAPFGYNALTNKGRFAVSIGTWFQAFDQILTQVQFEFSKETIETGVPLYARGNVSFKSYQQVYDTDIRGFFPGI